MSSTRCFYFSFDIVSIDWLEDPTNNTGDAHPKVLKTCLQNPCFFLNLKLPINTPEYSGQTKALFWKGFIYWGIFHASFSFCKKSKKNYSIKLNTHSFQTPPKEQHKQQGRQSLVYRSCCLQNWDKWTEKSYTWRTNDQDVRYFNWKPKEWSWCNR